MDFGVVAPPNRALEWPCLVMLVLERLELRFVIFLDDLASWSLNYSSIDAIDLTSEPRVLVLSLLLGVSPPKELAF